MMVDVIEDIVRNFFKDFNYDIVIVILILYNYVMMYLDMVFMMINYDQFIVYLVILDDKGEVDNWVLYLGKDGEIIIEYYIDIKVVFKQVLNKLEIDLILIGNGDLIVVLWE